MSKIITVWGNPGCGKSMFCCNLAKVLTAGKQKALIINADSSTPMLPVWMPERILETGASIGNVLTGLEINNALVAEAEKCREESPNWEHKIALKCIIGGKADEKGVEKSSQCPADIGTDIRCPAGDERVGRG